MTLRAFAGAAILAAASLLSSAAFAEPTPARGHDPDYATRKICRVTPVIGSRIGGNRTCRTRAEWEEFQRDQRLIVQRIQGVTPPCLMGPNAPGQAHLVC
jgi:hypothetical protein